ncbi:MAG: tetratricopeptide (TPR) repeat protein, partial [Verrucomicrobiales bacterium]
EEEFDPEDPENSVIFDHIARAFYSLGYRDEALEYMKQAIELNDEEEEYRVRLKEYTDNDPPEKVPVDFLDTEEVEDEEAEDDAPPEDSKKKDKEKSGDDPKTV